MWWGISDRLIWLSFAHRSNIFVRTSTDANLRIVSVYIGSYNIIPNGNNKMLYSLLLYSLFTLLGSQLVDNVTQIRKLRKLTIDT